jgi:pimeloyl-ACP methyl ester carboxylesterase
MHLILIAVTAVLVLGPERVTAQIHRVEEASFLTVGGIEQWVTIRGDDATKPVLLLVHGGPGDVQSPYVSTYAPYEKGFVLVQWDQRGAGRTFAKNGAAGVSQARLIADGLDLAQQLKRRFGKQKLFVLGHSWGSLVATGMVQQRPELFDAYVGTGQVTAWAGVVQFQFDFLKRRYRENGDAQALAALEAIGTPDPRNAKQYFGWSRPIRRFLPAADAAWFTRMEKEAIANGETEASMKVIGDGMMASGAALGFADMAGVSLRFALPYSVIQGRDDLFSPTPLAEAYFTKVEAPAKRLVVIEGAGHFALATHQAEVIAALRQLGR